MENEWVSLELKEVTEGKNPLLAQSFADSERIHLVFSRESKPAW